eukprot:187670_1
MLRGIWSFEHNFMILIFCLVSLVVIIDFHKRNVIDANTNTSFDSVTPRHSLSSIIHSCVDRRVVSSVLREIWPFEHNFMILIFCLVSPVVIIDVQCNVIDANTNTSIDSITQKHTIILQDAKK